MLCSWYLLQCLPSVAWADVVHVDKAPAARYIGDLCPMRQRPELWHEAPRSPAVVHFAGIRMPRKFGHTLLAVQSDAVCLVVAPQALGTAQHQHQLRHWPGTACGQQLRGNTVSCSADRTTRAKLTCAKYSGSPALQKKALQACSPDVQAYLWPRQKTASHLMPHSACGMPSCSSALVGTRPSPARRLVCSCRSSKVTTAVAFSRRTRLATTAESLWAMSSTGIKGVSGSLHTSSARHRADHLQQDRPRLCV